MTRIVPFEPWHVASINLQPSQRWMGPYLTAGHAEAVKGSGPAFSMLQGKEVIACSGIMHMWENRAQVWALISGNSCWSFVRMYRAMSRYLAMQDVRRIEATVDDGFEEGHRMLKMLGFEYEGRMRAYLPTGADSHLYARVK